MKHALLSVLLAGMIGCGTGCWDVATGNHPEIDTDQSRVRVSCFPDETAKAPKLESAGPPMCWGVRADKTAGPVPCPRDPSPTFDWQAIADHCHIEQLVHHRSANDPLLGPVFESPIPTNPASDSWEAV